MTDGQGAYNRVDALDKAVIHIPGMTLGEGVRFHQAAQWHASYNLKVVYGIFSLTFLAPG